MTPAFRNTFVTPLHVYKNGAGIKFQPPNINSEDIISGSCGDSGSNRLGEIMVMEELQPSEVDPMGLESQSCVWFYVYSSPGLSN